MQQRALPHWNGRCAAVYPSIAPLCTPLQAVYTLTYPCFAPHYMQSIPQHIPALRPITCNTHPNIRLLCTPFHAIYIPTYACLTPHYMHLIPLQNPCFAPTTWDGHPNIPLLCTPLNAICTPSYPCFAPEQICPGPGAIYHKTCGRIWLIWVRDLEYMQPHPNSAPQSPLLCTQYACCALQHSGCARQHNPSEP